MSNSDIVFFLSEVSDSSIPLELAAAIDAREGKSVEVVSLCPAGTHSFDVSVRSLGATSSADPRAYLRLADYLRDVSPTVLHVHPNIAGAAGRVVARLVDVPVLVTTEHSVHGRFVPLKNLVNGGTNWLNDAVISNSYATACEFRRWERGLLALAGTTPQVIYNGIRPEVIPAREEWQGDEVVIGTVGRLVDVKNHHRLIEAAAPLLGADTTLEIIGGGPNRSQLVALAERENVSEFVEFAGALSRDDVYNKLTDFDVFAFPSLAEGFGVAVVEAMAAGVPPVVSDIPALRELVGEAGYYVNPKEIGDIRTGLESVLEDEDCRRGLGEKAHQRARSMFSLEKTVEAHIQLYDALSAHAGSQAK